MYFQTLKSLDGTKTLAAVWPTTLTYCSGDVCNLETELLIGLDNLAHAIQQTLNVNNLSNDDNPDLAILEYHPEHDATVAHIDEIEDGVPHMAMPVTFYHEEELYKYRSNDEEYRKWYF